MTPYAFLYMTLMTILVRPLNRFKWLLHEASSNPKEGEVGTKGCFTQMALIHFSRFVRDIEDFNYNWVLKTASNIDQKMFQSNPQLYEYLFEPDVYVPRSERFFKWGKKQNPKRSKL